MNRDETKALLQRRHRLAGHSFNEAVLDTWAERLAGVDYGAAVVAMNRACDKATGPYVNWQDFKAHLDAHLRDRVDRHAEMAALDCELCGGTGWQPDGRDEHGRSRLAPCTTHRRRGRIIPASQGVAIAAVALEEELRSQGKPTSEIDRIISRWFGGGAA